MQLLYSYGYHGTGIRVLTLNVLATTDDFMSVDHKAFKTAVWEALDGTKKINWFFYMIACAMFPSSGEPVSRNQFHKI